jgi:CRISPR-associated protein Cas1
VKAAAERIGRLRRKARPRCTVPELMGVEGEATALYWPALGKCLRHGWRLRFRRRRPPPDPVNLVLSWTSALLYRDTTALLARHGLHPGFGVLHTSRDGAPALASDLIEALRAPIAEALTVTLFNNRVLDRDDFEKNADGSNRMDAEASRRMIREYERWLSQPVRLVPGGDEVLWRGVIEEQVLAYKRHIIDGEPFTPYAIGAKRGWPKPVT